MTTNTQKLFGLGALLTLLVGCGGSHDFPGAATVSLEQNPKMDQIMASLQKLESDVAGLKAKQSFSQPSDRFGAEAAPKTTKTTTAKPAPVTGKTPVAASGSASGTKPAAAPVKAPVAAKPDNKAQGRQQLDLVLKSITNINGFDAIVNKHEVGIQNGKTSDAKIRITGASPHRIRIEILQHETKKGLKVAYNGGASQISIRPNGMLSMISVSKPMNDPLVLSNNGQKPDEVDFYAMAKRMASPAYEAQLIGKTTYNGKEIHILKVTAPGGNTLNAQISHEYIGFDPASNQIVLWEAYSSGFQSGNSPFLRMSIDKFESLSSVSEQQLSV
ncbi:MAG TPA: hypothetical protein V6D23_28435 [Candidatus Obscuribacterales bacterium]